MRMFAGVLFFSLVGAFIPAAAAASSPRQIIEAKQIVAIQDEPVDEADGRYDWGASVMFDEGLYRMWWVRLGGANRQRFPYCGLLPDGERFEFTYPDRGDRVYYAESRDGRSWNIAGEDYDGAVEDFGPDAKGPLLVLRPAENEQQRMHLGCPSVIRVDDTYYMYYEACSVFILDRDGEGRPIVGDEYHNQVFLATSTDGRKWRHHPDHHDPQPILAAPDTNKQPGRQRYGLGQPSVCFVNGTYVMHYVDSCTAPGDYIVRLEADNAFFRNPRVFRHSLARSADDLRCPPGAVARFAQTDVKPLGDVWYLLRPAYGTGRLGLLFSPDGVFDADAKAVLPRDVFPQIATPDPLGEAWRERLFPRFLSDPQGGIRVEDGQVTIYYAAGLGWKDKAWSWDLRRCSLPISSLPRDDATSSTKPAE